MTSQIQYYVINGYEVDVYPVGWLSAWKHRKLHYFWHTTVERIRRRAWRALRMSLNGYLAEPRVFPHGVHRCGHGWTRRRALRDLRRLMREAGY